MTDDMLPNDGSTFYQPLIQDDEKQAEARQEDAKVADEMPIIQTATAFLEQKVAELKSIDAIPQHITSRPEEFMHVVAGNKIAASAVEEILTWFQALTGGTNTER
jgi:uncharacterized protein YhaN